MAQFLMKNRDDGHTIETHEFPATERLALYDTYLPGALVVYQQARYHVHTVAWNRTTQEFIVGVTFEAQEPAAPEVWC